VRQPLRFVRKLVVLVSLVQAVPSAAVSQTMEVIDRVLAIVAGQVITLSDVTAARELRLVSVTGDGDPVREVLTKLIDRTLMLDEVERYSPPVPEATAVDRAIAGVRARFNSDDAFNAALLRVGFTPRRLREVMSEDLRVTAYLAQRFAIPPLADQELARYYDLHRDEFTRDGRLVPLAEVRDEVARAAAEALRQNRIAGWVEGLRRRAEIADLYVSGR
jgi:hypothetical protein